MAKRAFSVAVLLFLCQTAVKKQRFERCYVFLQYLPCKGSNVFLVSHWLDPSCREIVYCAFEKLMIYLIKMLEKFCTFRLSIRIASGILCSS